MASYINKHTFKAVVPKCLWSFFRRRKILASHRKVAKYCDDLLRRYFNGDLTHFEIYPKKGNLNPKTIWQYWGQGFDCELPEVVSSCIHSVDQHRGECDVIRLDDISFKEYVSLPEVVLYKKDSYPRAFFADVLRLALMIAYGGVWLDATILMTGCIPDRYFNEEWFMFQRDPNEPYQEYWENAYAYYYGWHKGFKVNLLNSIIFSHKGNLVMKDLFNLLVNAWVENESLPDYFFFQILFNEYVSFTGNNCPIESDCRPQYLQQIVNDDFNYATVDEAIRQSVFHKFSYKEINLNQFREVLNNVNAK